MAKKIDGYIKLQIPAGQANPSPPVGPALGQKGVNIMEFCKAFNADTQSLSRAYLYLSLLRFIATSPLLYSRRRPPLSFVEEALGIKSGSGRPNTEKVGKVTRAQLEDIATQKWPDLTAADMDAAVRTIAGSARSAGIDVGRVNRMAKLSKRVRAFREKVDANRSYPLDEAIALLKEFGTAKFNETVEVAVNLGVDARKSDQGVRGATTLPHGTGSEVRVAVFTQGENAEKAKAAGADFVGMEELASEIKGGMMDFDVVVASPDAMRIVGQLGQVLGPRGLMPNPKTGTVTPDIEGAVKNAKAGQMRFRTDKNGIIHGGIGKVNFDADAIKGNLVAVLSDLKKAKPAARRACISAR